MRALCLFLVACRYIADPQSDPADPTLFSVHNISGDTLYLRVDDAYAPVVSVGDLRTSVSCADRLCSDSCDVVACTSLPAVRALAPDEALTVAWNNLVYTDGSSACGPCQQVQRVSKGRYDARVCYSRTLAGKAQHVTGQPAVLVGATLVDETCTDALNIALPNPDVHWGIDLR